MEIWALGESFGIGIFARFDCKWHKKDGTLSVWSKDGEDSYTSVTTNPGIFVEAIDESGNVVAEGGDGGWCYIPISKKPVRLRYKRMPEIHLSTSELDEKRKIVTRYLVSDAPYSLGIPSEMREAIKWMQSKLADIPKSCRESATFEFGTTMKYGETYPNIEISYREPETDEEVIKRIQIEAERARISNEKELATFRKLKTKFCAS